MTDDLDKQTTGSTGAYIVRGISSRTVARLVEQQFPQWAHLPIRPVEHSGWDNATFRLGDEFSVRLPSGDGYAAQVEKEHRWLPELAPQLPLAIPQPVAKGEPSVEFARPWSIYRWLPGEPAVGGRVADPTRLATELGGFLRVLYSLDPAGGPAAGSHSFFRGGSLTTYDAETRAAIHSLADTIDARAATEVWDKALAAPASRGPVWVHGDVAAPNLLLVDGRLAAVIDFGCCAVGDPACDVTMAWTFFSGDSRRAFRAALALEDATWARGRGWALWKALITMENYADPDAAARGFGWCPSARGVLDEVLVDS
jgi:aminoglycoside phosphotransferase (APT) family kinase protein